MFVTEIFDTGHQRNRDGLYLSHDVCILRHNTITQARKMAGAFIIC